MVVPHSATALGNLANFFQRVKGNPAIAQEFYLKAMQYDPNHPSVKRNYAILLRDFPELRTPNTVRLVGTETGLIVKQVSLLLKNSAEYIKMSKAHNPYGDGLACERILEFLINERKDGN